MTISRAATYNILQRSDEDRGGESQSAKACEGNDRAGWTGSRDGNTKCAYIHVQGYMLVVRTNFDGNILSKNSD